VFFFYPATLCVVFSDGWKSECCLNSSISCCCVATLCTSCPTFGDLCLAACRWLSRVQHCAVEHIHIQCAHEHQDPAASAWSQVGPIHREWVCLCWWRWNSVVLAARWNSGPSNTMFAPGRAAWRSAWNSPHGLHSSRQLKQKHIRTTYRKKYHCTLTAT